MDSVALQRKIKKLLCEGEKHIKIVDCFISVNNEILSRFIAVREILQTDGSHYL